MNPLEILQQIADLFTNPDKATELAAMDSAALSAKLTEFAAAVAEIRPNVDTDPASRTAFNAVAVVATKGREAYNAAVTREASATADLSNSDATLAAALNGLPGQPAAPAVTPGAPADGAPAPQGAVQNPAAPAVAAPGTPAVPAPQGAAAPVAPPAAAAPPAAPAAPDLSHAQMQPIDPANPVVADPAAHAAQQYGAQAADALLAGGMPSLEALAGAVPKPAVQNGIKAAAAFQAEKAGGLKAGDDATMDQIIAEFEEQHRSLQCLATSRENPFPLGGKVLLGKVEHARNSRTVFADDHPGMEMDELVAMATAGFIEAFATTMMQSLKASGGPCSQLESDYEVVLSGGDVVTSFISMLPGVVNNRRVSVYPWKVFSLADRPTGNFNKVTADQDTAGYYPATLAGDDLAAAIEAGQAIEKGCVRIDCPDPIPMTFHAIYQCLTIGNFINISFPEYVRVWREFIRVHFQAAREEDAIATYMAAARIINVTADVFGANRDLFSIVARFVSSIRGDRMSPNLPISLAFPSFTALELEDDHQKQMFHNSEMTALQRIASKIPNLNIGFYNVSAGTTTGGSPTVLPRLPHTPGTTAGLQTWPAQMRVLAWPTGAVYQQKVGQLGFGLRETGMNTNDFSEFSEVLEATQIKSPEDIYALDTKLCPQGEAAGSSVVAC